MALATRNLMEDLRASGEITGGPRPFSAKDRSAFLSALDLATDALPERVAELRRAGKRLMVVSNSAGYPKRVMMARYARLGFDFAPGEVVSSRDALLRHLSGEPRRQWGAMLSPSYGIEGFDADEAERKLTDAGLEVRREGGRVYFKDPDGIEVQVSGS